MAFSACKLPYRVKMGKITSVIHETSQMHGAQGSEVLEQGVRPDLVPFVRRIGKAVTEKQDVARHSYGATPIWYTEAMLDQRKSRSKF